MNNPRYPRAAKQMLSQMSERYKTAAMTSDDEPDGLGVRRTVQFDKVSSKFLAKTLPLILDPRVVAVSTKDGVLSVTFSPKRDADEPHPFPFDEAETVSKSIEDLD